MQHKKNLHLICIDMHRQSHLNYKYQKGAKDKHVHIVLCQRVHVPSMFAVHPVLTVVFPGSDFMERIVFLGLGVGQNFYGVSAHKFRAPGTARATVGSWAELSANTGVLAGFSLSPESHRPQ